MTQMNESAHPLQTFSMGGRRRALPGDACIVRHYYNGPYRRGVVVQSSNTLPLISTRVSLIDYGGIVTVEPRNVCICVCVCLINCYIAVIRYNEYIQ
jgi:hypothetical protein